MPTQDAERTWIPHLKGQFEYARPILFTGAGFSIKARNISGEAIPSTAVLKERIWNICFPGEQFDPSTSLQVLYENALLRQKNRLTDLLTQLLTVQVDSVPEWYGRIFSLPWQRCYTLNVDNLALATAQKFKLPRRIAPISATWFNPAGAGSIDSGEQLGMIHLNGVIADGADRVTFSTTQFAERLAQPEPWYVQFSADLVTSPVVFIGTELDEPPLWQHLAYRKHKGGREMAELRQRSYLVTPKIDRPRQALLSEFNVAWVPMTGEEFTRQVLGRLESSPEKGLQFLNYESKRAGQEGRLKEVSEIAVEPNKQNEFLLGNEPIWADLQSGRAISRESDEILQREIGKALAKPDRRGLMVVTGTAGSGKSTSLMRACLHLSADGLRVAWVDRESEISPGQIRAGMRTDSPPSVLAIDDADMYGTDLASWLRDLAARQNAPLIIVAIRSGRVDRVLNPIVLNDVSKTEISMPPLADADISHLIDLLEREKRLGVLTGKTREEQVRAFRDQAGRQLLVAMMQATSGKKFEEKAVRELLDLEHDAQQVYALVALASSVRFGLFRDELLIACADFSNTALNVVTQLVRRHIIVDRGDGAVWARHRSIAQVITDEMAKSGSLAMPVTGMARVAASKASRSLRKSDRAARMLRTFTNHDFLLRTVGTEVTRNLYGALEDALAWDYHFWLQRGSTEVETGDLNLAELYLNTARGLNPQDELLQTEWAYLSFKKACENPLAAQSPDAVKEATDTLEQLMNRIGDPYPYHVLGSQGLAWSRRGIVGSRERDRYLKKLIAKLDEGCRKYPKEKDLIRLRDDLRKEQLEIAAPSSTAAH